MIERYQQILKKTPVLVPADITSTDTNTAVVDLVNAQHCTFLVYTGSITSSSTTAPIITLMAATSAATTSATAIAFNYRKSTIIATDTWADIAAATATTAIAPTLALHTFEISHTLKTVRLFPERQFGGYALSLSGLRPGQNVEDASVPRLPPLISSARGPF